MISPPQSVADTQVANFLKNHPNAQGQRLSDGSWVLRIADVPLSSDVWAKSSTAVAFVVPAAFPVQRPDCFWADADLRFAGGRCPTNTGANNPCPYFGAMLWFSYHPQAWDVRDTVETYFHLIQGRLLDPR